MRHALDCSSCMLSFLWAAHWQQAAGASTGIHDEGAWSWHSRIQHSMFFYFLLSCLWVCVPSVIVNRDAAGLWAWRLTRTWNVISCIDQQSFHTGKPVYFGADCAIFISYGCAKINIWLQRGCSLLWIPCYLLWSVVLANAWTVKADLWKFGIQHVIRQ